jgi:hypothetical protein
MAAKIQFGEGHPPLPGKLVAEKPGPRTTLAARIKAQTVPIAIPTIRTLAAELAMRSLGSEWLDPADPWDAARNRVWSN